MSLRTLLIRGVLVAGIVATVNFPAGTVTRRAPKQPAPARQDATREASAPNPTADVRHTSKTAPPIR